MPHRKQHKHYLYTQYAIALLVIPFIVLGGYGLLRGVINLMMNSGITTSLGAGTFFAIVVLLELTIPYWILKLSFLANPRNKRVKLKDIPKEQPRLKIIKRH